MRHLLLSAFVLFASNSYASNRLFTCGATDVYSPDGQLSVVVYLVEDANKNLSAEISVTNQYEGVLPLIAKNLKTEPYETVTYYDSTENIFEPGHTTTNDRIFPNSKFGLILTETRSATLTLEGIFNTNWRTQLVCNP